MIGYFFNKLRIEDMPRVSHVAAYLARQGVDVALDEVQGDHKHQTIDLTAVGSFEHVHIAYRGMTAAADTTMDEDQRFNPNNPDTGEHYGVGFVRRTYAHGPIDEHIDFHAGSAFIRLRLMDYDANRAHRAGGILPDRHVSPLHTRIEMFNVNHAILGNVLGGVRSGFHHYEEPRHWD